MEEKSKKEIEITKDSDFCTNTITGGGLNSTNINYTNNLCITDGYITSGQLRLSNSYGITTSTSTNTLNINLDGYDIRDLFIKNILDKFIELKSLTKKSLYEFFDIKKISYLKDKTKIICKKEIDLEYIDDLKDESKLLNELIDIEYDDYKEKAIRYSKNKLSSTYLDISSTNLIWTGTDQNTITINNPNLVWGTTNLYTYNQNYITYTS